MKGSLQRIAVAEQYYGGLVSYSNCIGWGNVPGSTLYMLGSRYMIQLIVRNLNMNDHTG